MSRLRTLSLATLLLIVTTAPGCGAEDEADLASLVNRLPRSEDLPAVRAVDVVAAREALGIDEDTDPLEVPAGGDAEQRFVLAVGNAIPPLFQPQDSPLLDAFDPAQITAAATNVIASGPDAVTIVETDQSFDEIASSLEEGGFTREGDVLTSAEDPIEAAATAVAGGDGIVAIGFDAAKEPPSATIPSRPREPSGT